MNLNELELWHRRHEELLRGRKRTLRPTAAQGAPAEVFSDRARAGDGEALRSDGLVGRNQRPVLSGLKDRRGRVRAVERAR
jgi:hypothetical protein